MLFNKIKRYNFLTIRICFQYRTYSQIYYNSKISFLSIKTLGLNA